MGVGKEGVLGVQTPPEIKNKTFKKKKMWIKFNVYLTKTPSENISYLRP